MQTIKVTSEDIRNGMKYDCNSCPIVLAIRRYVTPGSLVSVTSYLAKIGANSYRLSITAQIFIYNFDNDIKVEPFEFELDI